MAVQAVALWAIIAPIVLSILRFIVGMSGVLILYAVVKSQLQPSFLRLINQIEAKLSALSSNLKVVSDLIIYLDFLGCISLIVSTVSMCFFLKLVAISAKNIRLKT